MASKSTDQIVDQHWCEVLGREDPVETDNFFAVGGNSLQAVDLARRLEAEFGGEFPLEVLFVDGTLGSVKGAAAVLRNQG